MSKRFLAKLSFNLRSIFRKSRVEHDMDQELRYHLDREIEKNISRGMNRSEARTAALLSFGGLEQTKEECRDIGWSRLLESLLQDLRFGFRILRKSPGFAAISILTLGLGIGANTAIFSVIYGVLLRPLPYQNGEQIVVLHQEAPLAGLSDLGFSAKEIEDYRSQTQTMDEIVEHHSMAFILLGGTEPARVQTGVVSANFFDVLGVKPALGRTFVPGDETHSADAVLILSYKYWMQHHGGDPSIVGKVFELNNRPHTVIGVLPSIPQYPIESDVYMPTSHCPTRSSERFMANRTARMMNVFGRLKSGVGIEQAQAEVSLIASHLQQDYPDAYRDSLGYRATVASLQEDLTRRAKPTFFLLLGTSVLVLLIACANVANLTLARVLRREREIAIRAALGAGRGRLIRQLLTESTLLTLAGGVVGIALAAGGLRLLVAFAGRFTTRADEIQIELPVLLFTLGVSVVTGLTFGLIPAFASQRSAAGSLKEGSNQSGGSERRQRLRSILIVAQVALSFVLLVGAGLTLRSLMKLQSVDPGFNPENVLSMRINLNWSKYNAAALRRGFYSRLLGEVESRPGVVSAAVGSSFPLNQLAITFGPFFRDFQIDGAAVQDASVSPRGEVRSVSPSFFQTLGTPLLAGRAFTDGDNELAPKVAIINETLARQYWDNKEPIGSNVLIDGRDSRATVVGVVADTREYGLEREAIGELYLPFAQDPGGGYLLVRTRGNPENMGRLVREAVYKIDRETAVDRVQTLDRARSDSVAPLRLTAVLLSLFATLALIITATGIAGAMSLTVSQRTHEIGIRLAMGATPTRALQMIMGHGVGLVTAGLALGIVVAYAVTSAMSTLLFEVKPTDPLTFIGVALLLLMVAICSCFVPARRVTSIDPMAALRNE